MTKKTNSDRIRRFEETLAVYGGNSSKWPEAERAALNNLADDDRDASLVLAEAVALDKAMALAPAGEPDRALRERIVAAALRDGSRDPRIVALQTRKGGESSIPDRSGRMWSGAALAASFALGLYLGIAGLAGNGIGKAFDLAGITGTAQEGAGDEFLTDGGAFEQDGLL